MSQHFRGKHFPEDRITRLKQALSELGSMRPGTLTRQYRKPKERKNPFWQLSYTHKTRSRSEYVRPESLAETRRQTANFRRFRQITDQWVKLSLELSRMRMKREKPHAAEDGRKISAKGKNGPT